MNSLPLTPAAPHRAQPGSGPSDPALSCLSPGTTLRLHQAAGQRLVVLSGRVWLTEPGDPDDHFLHAGESHPIASNGPVVIECDSSTPARLRLWPAAPR